MIKAHSIQAVVDAARIEEVVGEYVDLKKRGVNLLGNCPFHNEKSPSFTVSPTKGIYKCFGCAKGGDSIGFIMEHEQCSYPEAIRILAKKYNIELDEDENVNREEQMAEKSARESLFIVNERARTVMIDWLNTEEGSSIGLSYFKERRLDDVIQQKFELGYNLEKGDALSMQLSQEGFLGENIIKTGLGIRRESGGWADRFRGRVMFPIHNLNGRVAGFGGRVLKSDAKTAKYLNSPESDVYSKGKLLYGLFQGKKTIREKDKCYLVEGYMDVLAMHRAGVENAVASSGTSLTEEQCKLIGRFTQNVTILFDGDSAGIKASIRGIDILLEQDMNVRLVLFPEGADPDEYLNANGSQALQDYIANNEKDFILYRTSLLSAAAKTDPIKKAELIQEILESIVKIPNAIKRSIYTGQCAQIMDVEEGVLVNELNKIFRKKLNKAQPNNFNNADVPEHFTEPSAEDYPHIPSQAEATVIDETETEIARLLLEYANEIYEEGVTVGRFIIENLDDVEWRYKRCETIVNWYKQNPDTETKTLISTAEVDIKELITGLITERYSLSENWVEMHKISIPTERDILKTQVTNALYVYKIKKTLQLIDTTSKELKAELSVENQTDILLMVMQLNKIKIELAAYLKNVIIR